MRFLLLLLPLAAAADIPKNLPPLPEDGSVCNTEGTHCVVNYLDWMAIEAESSARVSP